MNVSYVSQLDIFRSPGMWDKFGLDWILGKGYRLFKFIGKFKDGIRHLPQEFLVDNNYILGLVWENNSIYLFDSHLKDENDSLLSSGIAVLLKFNSLCSLENRIRSVYYSISFWLFTVKSNLLEFAVLPKPKMSLNMHKKTRKARQEKYLLAKKRKHVAPEKKR